MYKKKSRERAAHKPAWQSRNGAHRLIAGPEIVGRVDFIEGIGYWWQTAHATGTEKNLFDAQRRVERSLSIQQLSTFDPQYWMELSHRDDLSVENRAA